MLTPNPNVAYLYSLLAVVCFLDSEDYSPGKKNLSLFLRKLSQLAILFLSLFSSLMLTRPCSVVQKLINFERVWLEPSPLPLIVSCRDNGRHFRSLSLLTERV